MQTAKSVMKLGALHFTKIKRIMREYSEQLYANKLENLDKVDKFLDSLKQPN